MLSTGTERIWLAALTPLLLEKGVFEPGAGLKLQAKQNVAISALVQKLIEAGYERVQSVGFPAEFSSRGGILDVFPADSPQAWRLEFFGNQIERITALPLTAPDEESVRSILRQKLKAQKIFSGLAELKPGDYVVHLDHGVAKFISISYLVSGSWYSGTEIQNTKYKIPETKYYVLEYTQGDKLFVPQGLERKLSKYVGFVEPRISRLGLESWQRTKSRVKEEVVRFARELLQIYAQRETATRPPYRPDPQTERLLEDTFPFQETPDQMAALEQIRRDLTKERPMDRLLCGDVGFGKTEIALRVMADAVSSGRQALLLCPTTILAQQHFDNFQPRLEKTAIRVELLNRLKSPREQKRIIERFCRGQTDILVGTHRLLSKDVLESLHQLGLLVIDDEQKFGVRQKEKFKKLRASLDVLSLSATPIPRTLYLALSALREVSFVTTPPPGRRPVKTKIAAWSKILIKQAIERELARGGQVYYLHNRVQTIEKTKLFLEKLWPSAKIGVIHGRRPEKELIRTMEEFRARKTNILLATTIIENGLDLPSVNTIIVEDAQNLGLSQAHQIRGRVGRFDQQAFAFFLHRSRLSPLAKERLVALREAESLGSGYQIARRDLEIRGAGNILGQQQSGSVNQVGLNLYCQMLAEAVARQKEKG